MFRFSRLVPSKKTCGGCLETTGKILTTLGSSMIAASIVLGGAGYMATKDGKTSVPGPKQTQDVIGCDGYDASELFVVVGSLFGSVITWFGYKLCKKSQDMIYSEQRSADSSPLLRSENRV